MKWICKCCSEEYSRRQQKCRICDSPRFDEQTEPIDLRDFFAGCALIALMGLFHDPQFAEGVAENAFEFADAMMKEREK